MAPIIQIKDLVKDYRLGEVAAARTQEYFI
jgi:hypothetical protein